MIDVLRKLGFRNENHLIWFVNSIFFGTFVVFLRWGALHRWVFLLPIGFYLYVIIAAFVVTILRKETSDVYSKDCMWFNTLMLLFYGILMWRTH